MTSSDPQAILHAALLLAPAQRAWVAEQLLESLPEDEASIREAWQVEINRRVREVEEGKVAMLPLDEVLNELRARKRP